MAEPGTGVALSMTTLTEDAEQALRAWEIMGRIAVGLALDGVTVSVTINHFEITDEGDE